MADIYLTDKTPLMITLRAVRSIGALVSGALLMFSATFAQANRVTSDPAYPTFKQDMVANHGFNAAALDELFEQVNYKDNILEIMSRPGESKPWYAYRDMIINQNRINLGRRFASDYADTLRRAEQTYGVPADVILGILGVETVYGTNKGSFLAIEALTTLAFGFDRRSEFFTNELKELLLMSREMNINPLRIKSSYAGAIGYPQFMPSSYRKWAVDFDGSGEISLNSSPVDAIGSIANYLKQHGWQPGVPVGYPATYSGMNPESVITEDLTQLRPAQFFSLSGLSPNVSLSPDTLVAGVMLEDNSGPVFWLTTYNYHVITTYNRSRKYASAVWRLGQLVSQ